ncbi:asparagine synthase-related protein [Francisella tularensis]|uniref:asparagine synthase-related protein n=1 Tax=Francisella tularensis TaxID=263 RepID=UPI0001855405|nr:asparagine synthase-related protein [Francisella tularensis]APC95544.1 glutamine amidotransferase domain protein [Francisella tularensis subsp. novicida]EDZ91425.1 asparagine synthase family protein [Francisella tularensis subsp. novicida FTG]MBK2336266.1 asparagine synthetase B family protein [Francisella tularensis subsp. novicida]MBK2346583.1 asparagine synthetase B family protein [Francisella tularensis subsp. novicida]
MFHGIFFRKDSNLDKIPQQIVDGTNPKLNIDPQRKIIKTIYDKNYWFAQALEKDSNKSIYIQKNIIIVGWIKLYNRDEIFSELQLEYTEKISDEELIVSLYNKYKSSVTKYLHGDYSFVIFDSLNNQAVCVRDHMGTRPFYYYLDENIFVFSSSQVLFNLLDIIDISASQEWICRLIAGGTNMNFKKTAYNEIFKIPPAHFLEISNHHSQIQKYFEFSTEKIILNNDSQYFEEYENKVKQAIIERFINSKHPIGSEISGGIDSSTVTAYIANYFDQPISNLYTYGFTKLEQEPEYALLVNQVYGLPNAFICSGNSYDENNCKNPLDILGAPVEHGNATFHEIFYKNASQNGVRSLFSGFGGDEFVTSIHGDLVAFELLAKKDYIGICKHFGGNIITKPLRILRFLVKNNIKHGKKSFNMLNAFKQRWPYFCVKDEFVKKYHLKDRYFEVANFDNGYTNLDKFTLEKRWVSFVPTRTDNCSLMAAAYGIDYFWPLLDVRLIQSFLSMPNTLKFHNGYGRYLHRKAVEKIVPKKIIWKKSKYMGEPFTSKINIKSKLELDTDLHPQLLILLDIDKLKTQIADYNNSIEIDKSVSMVINRNIADINAINQWLKHFDLKIK